MSEPYVVAQTGISQLKAAIFLLLSRASETGLTNAEIGRSLGIYMGGHEGHIPRTLLAVMEAEGVVEQQAETKQWRLRSAEDRSKSQT